MAAPAKKTRLVKGRANTTAFYGGSRIRPGAVTTIRLAEGEKPPAWLDVIDDAKPAAKPAAKAPEPPPPAPEDGLADEEASGGTEPAPTGNQEVL